MGPLESVYCYIYQHNQDQNSGADSRKSGTMLASVVVLMWVISIFFIGLPFGLGDGLIDILQAIFGYSSGKTIGRVGAAAIFFLIYPFIYLTKGTEKGHQKILDKYLALEKEEQVNTAAKGMGIFMITSIVFVIAVIVGAIGATYF